MNAAAGLEQIESYYDEVPRAGSRTEEIGPFTLFVSTGPFTFYARPHRQAAAVAAADVAAVLDRQRELGVPFAFEWIDDLHPDLAATVTAAGLAVFHAPLLRYDPAVAGPAPAVPGVSVRVLAADDPDLPLVQAAIGVGFGHPGTAVGAVGVDARDDAARAAGTDHPEVRRKIAEGSFLVAGAFVAGGAVGGGSHSPRGAVTEITGVATLPAYRRRGIGAAVTSGLVADALRRGVTTVFLSAGSHDIARIYRRSGFRAVGSACIASAPAAGAAGS